MEKSITEMCHKLINKIIMLFSRKKGMNQKHSLIIYIIPRDNKTVQHD